MVELPVVVNPVDDPVVINASQWMNLSFPEDTTFVAVGPLAYDVDGDELTWTLEGLHRLVSVLLCQRDAGTDTQTGRLWCV